MSLRCEFISKSCPHNISQGKRKLSWIRRVLMCSVWIYNSLKVSTVHVGNKVPGPETGKSWAGVTSGNAPLEHWYNKKKIKQSCVCSAASTSCHHTEQGWMSLHRRAERRASRCDLPSSSFLTSLEAKKMCIRSSWHVLIVVVSPVPSVDLRLLLCLSFFLTILIDQTSITHGASFHHSCVSDHETL